DLWLEEYQKLFEERARLAPEKRRESPLVVSTHPDFLTFPPDGPLAQISIEQVRKLKEYAQFGPVEGRRRLFLVDHADRIDGAAANSLLKTLEEPPPYLTIILTAENAYDLLPTVRSRSVPFYFAPLHAAEMERFLAGRQEIRAADRARVSAWAQGSPGRALAIDIATYEKRRAAMLALLRSAAGAPFGEALRHTEALGRSKQEKLELLLEALYGLLADLLHLKERTAAVANEDIRGELEPLAGQVDFAWLEAALEGVDELESLGRRNIQKQIALEALAVGLRERPGASA
ncbi:MAG TPA: DNA polymerase III subunit delta', partial [Bryobacterales bacterium]|nr:DNA polymerase III subunit delta' [Bryobacterales bacterium]